MATAHDPRQAGMARAEATVSFGRNHGLMLVPGRNENM
jgi:hypothetical protein